MRRPSDSRSRPRLAILLALAVSLAAGLPACAGPAGPKEKLRLSARDVFDALQFGDFQVVAGYLRPDLRTEFLARAYGVEKTLKIVEFVPIGMDVAADETTARLTTRLSWYELPSLTVETENLFVDFRQLEGVWQIEQIVGGPLPVPDPAAVDAPPPPPVPAAPTAPAAPTETSPAPAVP